MDDSLDDVKSDHLLHKHDESFSLKETQTQADESSLSFQRAQKGVHIQSETEASSITTKLPGGTPMGGPPGQELSDKRFMLMSL